MTLTTRLSVFFLATLALVLAGFSATLYGLAHTYLHRQMDDRPFHDRHEQQGRKTRPDRKRCSCPRISSNVRGRIRAASGSLKSEEVAAFV